MAFPFSVFIYPYIPITPAAIRNISTRKYDLINSDVAIRAWVAAGSSTSAVSKRGVIAGITYVRTMMTERNKNKNIIVGYVRAHLIF